MCVRISHNQCKCVRVCGWICEFVINVVVMGDNSHVYVYSYDVHACMSCMHMCKCVCMCACV